jgi:glycosyltransferase involved in cell wall biosynthesis
MSLAQVSIVIISLNAARTISKVVNAARLLSDDVVVVDSGSTDSTKELAKIAGATLIHKYWEGYGQNKNAGNTAAKYDWILSIDSDEVVSPELIQSISSIDFKDCSIAYELQVLNYLGEQPVHHGAWQKDWHIRLFNRQVIQWDHAPVHEQLILPESITINKLNGWLHHYTAPDIEAYENKLDHYAQQMAMKYFLQGKKAPLYKCYLSPVFNFSRNYLFKGGWMDRKQGWQIAIAHAAYTFKKYQNLRMLHQSSNAAK